VVSSDHIDCDCGHFDYTCWAIQLHVRVAKVQDTDKLMDTLERFYIFRETKINNQINDRLTIKPNVIFEAVVQKDSHRGLTAACKHLSNNN
jgi:hypothetical protein